MDIDVSRLKRVGSRLTGSSLKSSASRRSTRSKCNVAGTFHLPGKLKASSSDIFRTTKSLKRYHGLPSPLFSASGTT